MLTPLILGFVVMSVFAGILTNMVGYSNPAMIVGAVLSSVGSGLLTTFALNTPSSKWIGYQVLFGFGIGFGLQQPMLVVQTVLPPEDIPIGVSLITLSQMVSGSIFVSVSQSIFQNTIVGIHNVYPNISVDTLLTTGATNIPALFSDDQLLRVLPIYRNAIVNTFYVALALSCLSILGALGTEWKSMKTKAVGAEVEH
jgi:MFS family permease